MKTPVEAASPPSPPGAQIHVNERHRLHILADYQSADYQSGTLFSTRLIESTVRPLRRNTPMPSREPPSFVLPSMVSSMLPTMRETMPVCPRPPPVSMMKTIPGLSTPGLSSAAPVVIVLAFAALRARFHKSSTPPVRHSAARFGRNGLGGGRGKRIVSG